MNDTLDKWVWRSISVGFVAAGILMLYGCAKDPVSVENTDNKDVKLEKLFTTPDSCAVYRFLDDGNYHYFANCPNSSVSEQHSCGKGCVREDTTTTTPTPDQQ